MYLNQDCYTVLTHCHSFSNGVFGFTSLGNWGLYHFLLIQISYLPPQGSMSLNTSDVISVSSYAESGCLSVSIRKQMTSDL